MPRTREFDADEALRNAMELFWNQGYAATSMADVVEHLGVARAGIYQEFGGKRGLFLRALALYTSERDADIERRLTGGGSPLARLHAVVEDFAVAGSRGRSGCLVTNSAVEFAGHDAEVGELVAASWRRVERALTACLIAARDQGELPAGLDAAAWARTLVVVMQGTRVMGRARARRPLARTAVRTTLAALA